MSVGNDRNQRLMAIGLPLVFVVFVIQFAAGLLVYWIASNLTMLPQQYYMLRKYGRPATARRGRDAAGAATARCPRATPRRPRRRSRRPAAGGSRAAPRTQEAVGPASMTELDDELSPEDELRDLLETLVEAFGVDAQIVTTVGAEEIRGAIEGPGAQAFLIDDGAVIEAVQHLAQRIVLRGAGGLRVIVDAGGYRARREAALRDEADRAAERVLSEGRGVALSRCRRPSAVTCTSICVSAAMSPRIARATSRTAVSSFRPATEPLARFTFFLTVKQHPPALKHCGGWTFWASSTGLVVGVLIGEGSFGGDGRQPHVTLRMHVRHEALFRWLVARFPRTRLYGPYGHGGRSYYQWMARGQALVEDVLPVLESPRSARSTVRRRPSRGDARALRRLLRPPRAVSAAERLDALAARQQLAPRRAARNGSSRSSRGSDRAHAVRDAAGRRRAHGGFAQRARARVRRGCAHDRRSRLGRGISRRRARVRTAERRGRAGRKRRAQVRVPRATVRGRAVPGATVVHARAEEWREGLATRDLVVARAVASLAVICEYAAPLLQVGGALVAWKGAVAEAEAQGGARAAGFLVRSKSRQWQPTCVAKRVVLVCKPAGKINDLELDIRFFTFSESLLSRSPDWTGFQ